MVMNATSTSPLLLTVDRRSVLRPFELTDADALFEMVESDRDYLSWRLPLFSEWTSIELVREAIAGWLTQRENNGSLYFGLWHQGQLEGLLSFEVFDSHNGFAAIGFTITSRLQGTGLAYRAARTMLDHAFDTLHFHRLIARCTVDNGRAMRLLARLGFESEGVLKDALKIEGRFIDLHSYSLLAPAWRSQPGSAPTLSRRTGAFGSSAAVRVGSQIWVAGLTALGATGSAPMDGHAAARQTHVILDRLAEALAEVHADLTSVMRMRLYLTDLRHGEAVSQAIAERLEQAIALTAVEVKALQAPDLLVEIETDAFLA